MNFSLFTYGDNKGFNKIISLSKAVMAIGSFKHVKWYPIYQDIILILFIYISTFVYFISHSFVYQTQDFNVFPGKRKLPSELSMCTRNCWFSVLRNGKCLKCFFSSQVLHLYNAIFSFFLLSPLVHLTSQKGLFIEMPLNDITSWLKFWP